MAKTREAYCYHPHFRVFAIENVVHLGCSVGECAKLLKVERGSIYVWLKQYHAAPKHFMELAEIEAALWDDPRFVRQGAHKWGLKSWVPPSNNHSIDKPAAMPYNDLVKLLPPSKPGQPSVSTRKAGRGEG